MEAVLPASHWVLKWSGPEGIRTPNLHSRNVVLYPIEPQNQIVMQRYDFFLFLQVFARFFLFFFLDSSISNWLSS